MENNIYILRDSEFVLYKDDLHIKNNCISFKSGEKILLPLNAKYIIPGYIDRHTHGGYGVDYMDGDEGGNEFLLTKLASEGITTVIPTTMTMNYEQIYKCLETLKKYSGNGVRVRKSHLEGPFLNSEKIGAQNPKYLKEPDVNFLKPIKEQVAMVSFAPELDKEFEFTDYLNSEDIVSSVVHSNASAYTIEEANKHGLKSFSHFYNGSSGYSHRNPGVVNAGLSLNNVNLELICDGFHIDPFVIKQTYEQKGTNSIILITDSMRAKGLNDGEYDLGGQKVILANGQVRLASGSLAGSVLSMEQAVKNFVKFTSCSYAEAILCASTNVARSLGFSDIGSIEEMNKFDIVILDENLNVLTTYVEGKLKYEFR